MQTLWVRRSTESSGFCGPPNLSTQICCSSTAFHNLLWQKGRNGYIVPWNVTALPLGERLKQAREAAGLSAAAAGVLIEVHENTVYALEKDAESKTLKLVRKAASVYGITDAQLFGAAAPVVPPEYRPLMTALEPLDREARENIIRNIASNLRFMSSLFATVQSQSEETENAAGSYSLPKTKSGASDGADYFGDPGGDVEPVNPEPNRQVDARRPTRRHGPTTKGKVTR
jgi:transcriptional regulator with XRE-family HTH domain